MAQENKELLLKDLSARLPYGVFMTNKKLRKTFYPLTCDDLKDAMFDDDWDDIPYLRPLSSMTEEEKEEYQAFFNYDGVEYPEEYIDWLNKHHFDYRGLIEKGLALEAPKDMYNIK